MRVLGLLSKHKTFVGYIATMMSGKTVAAAIALVTMPIIARLFSPADFGVAAVFLSLTTMVTNVGALRYEGALVLPKSDSDALLLMALCYRVLAAVCIVILVVVAIYELADFPIAVFESLGIWLWFWPIGVLLMTMIQIQESWLDRKQHFRVVAASMVVGTSVTGGSRIGFGLLAGTSVFGLIFGHMLGQISRLAVQKSASSEGLRATLQRIDATEIRRIAREYADFPKLNAPAGLLTAVTQQLPVVLFGALFAPAIVGYYSMATRLTSVPAAIFASSVRRVFLQKAAKIHNRGRSLTYAYLVSTGGLVILGAIPLALLWFYGQPLATWLLGAKWEQAGRYLEIISPWLFILLVSAPANSVFVVLRKQRLWLIMQLFASVIRLSTFGIAYLLSAGPEWTLGAFVITTVAGNLSIIIAATLLTVRTQASQPPQSV